MGLVPADGKGGLSKFSSGGMNALWWIREGYTAEDGQHSPCISIGGNSFFLGYPFEAESPVE